MFKFIDVDHPFYRPLWRRLLIVLFCVAWTAVEFYNGATTWGFIFLAVGAYAACSLLIFFNPKDKIEAAAENKPAGDDPA
ncbi:hypothetical protein [Pararhizobium arenae]|uniref:hypothetical protein n=1 Tax=Pararhizobium arenae TaxID=1856850 RepID=UPI00094B193D|nr:hypothetical protein [Pararhizobium arenae]